MILETENEENAVEKIEKIETHRKNDQKYKWVEKLNKLWLYVTKKRVNTVHTCKLFLTGIDAPATADCLCQFPQPEWLHTSQAFHSVQYAT